MHRFVRGLAVLTASVALVVAPSAGAAGGKAYHAPFKLGPSGGDQFSYHSASTDGTVTVGRVYPIPGVINCTKGGPYAKLLVLHKATAPVHKVVVTYDTALVDPFTFVQVGLRDAAYHWYGQKTLRGMVSGSGTVTMVPVIKNQGRMPRTLVIEFGLEQSSACPNADEGTIHFSEVRVS